MWGRFLGGEVQIFLFPSHLPVKLSCMKKGAEALRHHFHRFSLIFILQTVVRVSCVHHWNLRCAEDSTLIMSTPQILCQGSSWTPWNSCFSAGPYYNLCRRGPTRSSQSIRMVGKWWENISGPSCVPKLFGKKVTQEKPLQLRKDKMSFQGMEAFLIKNTDWRTQGVCRCEVVQCRSHMKNKGTQLNDWPQPKGSPTSLSQLIQMFWRWWYKTYQIMIIVMQCYTYPDQKRTFTSP